MIVLFTYFLDCYRENKLLSFHIRKLVSLTVVLLQGFPDSSVGKESACNAGDLVSVPGLRRSSGEGKGYPLQYSGLGSQRELDMTEQLSLYFHGVVPVVGFNPFSVKVWELFKSKLYHSPFALVLAHWAMVYQLIICSTYFWKVTPVSFVELIPHA